jgi:hypothetical protein
MQAPCIVQSGRRSYKVAGTWGGNILTTTDVVRCRDTSQGEAVGPGWREVGTGEVGWYRLSIN